MPIAYSINKKTAPQVFADAGFCFSAEKNLILL